MNRKILIAVLVLSLSVVMAVALVAPSFAHSKKDDDSNVVVYGQHGEVILQLPSGIPSRPTALRLIASDFNKKSEFGAVDTLMVALWIPAASTFVPVAQIVDDSNPDRLAFIQMLFNNTPIWRVSPAFPNVIQVADKDLDVWKEDDVIFANLTTTVKITLPFDQMPMPQKAWGNLTFNLPPMMLTFRPIARDFHYEETVSLLPHPPLSGYTIEVTSMQSPAWVTADIPSWIHGGWLEATGHICTHLTQTDIPPAA